jgi:hypothetical protein
MHVVNFAHPCQLLRPMRLYLGGNVVTDGVRKGLE